MKQNILDGYNILGLAQHLAGPSTTQLIAEMATRHAE